MSRRRTAARTLSTLTCLVGLILLSVAQWPGGSIALAAGTISGRVYQDYNGNGTRDVQPSIPNTGGGNVLLANDRGVAGVTVTAYDSTGAAVGTATSGVDGSYSLVTAQASTGPYRVEFTGIQGILPGFQPGPAGTNNGTTIRFVPNGGAANVDLGIIVPGEYCQNNPTLVTSCYKKGGLAGLGSTEPTMLSFPYNAGSESATTLAPYRQPASGLNVPAATIGSVWGLEHSPRRDRIYAAAFFKKHIALGPGAVRDPARTYDEDPGAIYVLNQSTGALETVFTVPNATANPRTFSTALAPDPYRFDDYDVTWNAVGKVALGGIALSEDEATLYVMNLENRTLYALNAVTGAVTGSQAVPGVANAATAPPLPGGARCAQSDIRPFAVTFYRGLLYVGITCTAESTATVDSFTDANGNGRFDHNNQTERNSVVDGDGNGIYNRGDVRGLRSYVYTVNPATLAFGAAPALEIPLNYPRGIANQAGAPPAEWRTWIPGFDYISIGEATIYYPQPWLTDITFDNGNMVLGIRDRTGDTTGYDAPADPTEDPNRPGGPTLYDGVGVGDLLRACVSQNGWTLESNGSCGGIATTPRAPATEAQGPGGGEYYFDDGYGIRGQDVNHDEVSAGGGTQVPGYPDVVVTTFDAFPFRGNGINEVYNGGFRWYNNGTGAYDKAYVVFDTDGADPLTVGKANGLGDLIVLCDEAPIEIGNLVWRDDDLDGVQDPNEPPIPNVTLELYENVNGTLTLIGTAVTDANGNYLFSAYRTAGASNTAFRYGLPLRPNTTYEVRIPNATGPNQQPALTGLTRTLANNEANNGDPRDSDGLASGSSVLTTLTTGGVGANNHTYDFGFVAVPTSVTLGSFTAERAGATVVVRWQTSAEVGVWGFNLYRSETGHRADAVQVNGELIAARGRGAGGASYSYRDTAVAGGPYSYWIEEVALDGRRTEYGPALSERLSAAEHRIWLPLIQR